MSYPKSHNQGPPPGYTRPPQFNQGYGQQLYGGGNQGYGGGPHHHQRWFGQNPQAGGMQPHNPSAKNRRRRCDCMYHTFRHFTLIIPFIILILNINIYAAHKGRYERYMMTAEDPVFYDLWLTVPLAAVVLIWAIANLISMRRVRYRGGIPLHVQFGVELMLALGTAVCWVLVVVQVVSKQSNNYYDYPFIQYEGALAFLVGLLMVVEFALCARALSEFNSDRKQRENGGTDGI